MNIGPFVRGMFGRYELQVSDAYRSIYIDIDAFVDQTRRWKPVAGRILEVGCGEGAVTQRLKYAYPDAEIIAIDITERIGRLYQGPPDGVRFVRCAIQDIAAAEAARYDLIVLCDVLHHVPMAIREDLLGAIRERLAARGTFVFKDWQRSRAPIHWLCHASDRWLTGDRVSFMTRGEMRASLARTFGDAALIAEARIGPWWNNLAILVQHERDNASIGRY